MEIWGVGVRHISNILVPSEKDIYVYEKPIDINITIPDQKGNHYSMQQVLEGNVNIAKPEDNFHAVFSPYSELINCEGRNIPVLILPM
ncbi:MAG: hypothetical protein CV045_07415 [Cyanobacteria bacterium M5B4]|nr:MAG: hypothetical protein CV045_07415 [Cyanobacteria bacterium M5B4]